MCAFNLNSFGNNSIINDSKNRNPKYDTVCFKECITGIDNYWKELIADLETKKKDIIELTRMYNTYNTEEYQYLIDNINTKITEIEDKLCFIQKIVWDIRSRIIFSK